MRSQSRWFTAWRVAVRSQRLARERLLTHVLERALARAQRIGLRVWARTAMRQAGELAERRWTADQVRLL